MGAAAAAQGGLGALQFLEAKNQADSLERQAEFEAQQRRFNAELIGIQQQEIYAQAERDVQQREQNVKRMIGTQRATLAAQGIEVDSELGAILEAEERRVGMEDVEAIKNNSWREAMGLEIRKSDMFRQAEFAEVMGADKKRATLATGGLQAVSTGLSAYRNYRKGY